MSQVTDAPPAPIKMVAIQFTLTDAQLTALVRIKRGLLKGWGAPEDIYTGMVDELGALGLVNELLPELITAAGELVIVATGNDSVVNQ